MPSLAIWAFTSGLAAAPGPFGARGAGRHLAESAGAVVADAHQQRQQHVVAEQRRAAVADERQRDAGERQEPGDAAHDDERLQAEERGEPGGEQLLEGVVGAQGDAQPGADHEQEADEDRRGAEQPELLADGGEDEVGLDHRDALGVAEAEAGAADAAPARANQLCEHLEAVAKRSRATG